VNVKCKVTECVQNVYRIASENVQTKLCFIPKLKLINTIKTIIGLERFI